MLIYQQQQQQHQIRYVAQVTVAESGTKEANSQKPGDSSSVYPIHQNISIRVKARLLTPGLVLTILRQKVTAICDECRFHFIPPGAKQKNSLSHHFQLDHLNGHLTLVARFTGSRLRQQISLVQLVQNKDASRFRVNRLVNLELFVVGQFAHQLEQRMPSRVDVLASYALVGEVGWRGRAEVRVDLPVVAGEGGRALKMFRLNRNSSNIVVRAVSDNSRLIFAGGEDSGQDWVILLN